MILLITTAVLLALGLLGIAYTPRPLPSASGSSIHVPGRRHSGAATPIRVATYNIHRARGADGRRDLRRVAEVIRGAGIVALQEVGVNGTGRGNQVQRLGEQLDMGCLFAPTRQRWFRQDRGNGLLTVFPLNHWHYEPLPHSARRTPRNLASARVLVNGKELWLLVTHLNTRDGRGEQLQIVLDRFRQYTPAILLADLNTTRADPLLSAYFEEEPVVDALGIALAEHDPPQRVDWIITRGLDVVAGGMEDNIASDHPYYWVDVSTTA